MSSITSSVTFGNKCAFVFGRLSAVDKSCDIIHYGMDIILSHVEKEQWSVNVVNGFKNLHNLLQEVKSYLIVYRYFNLLKTPSAYRSFRSLKYFYNLSEITWRICLFATTVLAERKEFIDRVDVERLKVFIKPLKVASKVFLVIRKIGNIATCLFQLIRLNRFAKKQGVLSRKESIIEQLTQNEIKAASLKRVRLSLETLKASFCSFKEQDQQFRQTFLQKKSEIRNTPSQLLINEQEDTALIGVEERGSDEVFQNFIKHSDLSLVQLSKDYEKEESTIAESIIINQNRLEDIKKFFDYKSSLIEECRKEFVSLTEKVAMLGVELFECEYIAKDFLRYPLKEALIIFSSILHITKLFMKNFESNAYQKQSFQNIESFFIH